MSAVFTPTRTRISVERFHRMMDAGVLTKYDRVELINGEMIDMAPIGSQHAHALTELSMTLTRAVSGGIRVATQSPVVLSEDSQPQPDLMLLRPRPGGYAHALPTPAEVLLLVEVSDTTLDYDRGTKLPLYAAYGITEVWIVNLRDKRLEVYREPDSQGYRRRLELQPDDIAAPTALPDVAVTPGKLFP